MQPRKDANARRIHPNCFPINPACPAASAAARGRARRLPMRLATALLALVAGPALAQFATPDAINVPMTIADASADEGDAITFTVTLDKAMPGGITVTPSFTDGTATNGTDYTENTAALAFLGTSGETRNITVSTTEDLFAEGDETFTVSLAVTASLAGNTYNLATNATATGRIIDDDTATETIENEDEVTARPERLCR